MEGVGVAAKDTAAEKPLTTAAVSAASGYCAQQIRDLEALGVIAPAPRTANGYRRFEGGHVRDLRAYRGLAAAIGPVHARRALREVRRLPRDQAVALLSSFHVALTRERDEALAAREALQMIRDEATYDAQPAREDSMTITQLAEALGVRTSTLRFWEKAGLIAPERVAARTGSARRYPLPAIREARITAALRAAGYGIPDVQHTMAAIRGLHHLHEPFRALDRRVEDIARRTLALLRAGADITDIITAPPAPAERTQAHGRQG